MAKKIIITEECLDFENVDYRDFISIFLAFLEKNQKNVETYKVLIQAHSKDTILNNTYIRILSKMGFELHLIDNISKYFRSVSQDSKIIFLNKKNFNFFKKEFINIDIELFDFESIKKSIFNKNSSVNEDYKIILSRKSHEANTYNSNSYFEKYVYISGHMPRKPKIDDLIIAPHWSWIDKSNVVLSGVNFVKILSKNIGYKLQNKSKKYRSVYIGSSSINKNAVPTLILVAFSRLISSIKGIGQKKDKFIIRKFYGVKGNIVWSLLFLLSLFIKLFRIRIDIIFLKDDQKLSHKEILEISEKAHLGLVTYLREGFPRIIGEYLVSNTYPLIWNSLSFGDGDINDKNLHSLSEIFRTLIKKNHSSFKDANNFKNICVEKNDIIDRLRGKKTQSLYNQLKFLDEENVIDILYIFLTSDVSWIKEMRTEKFS